jgi:hypothetical protein
MAIACEPDWIFLALPERSLLLRGPYSKNYTSRASASRIHVISFVRSGKQVYLASKRKKPSNFVERLAKFICEPDWF